MTTQEQDITFHLLEERDVNKNITKYGLFTLSNNPKDPILCFCINSSLNLVALDYVRKKNNSG